MKSKKSRRVTLTLHPVVAKDVQRLLESGLYGLNYTKVIEGLFLAGLREAVMPTKWSGR
jgi:hypothetical protein